MDKYEFENQGTLLDVVNNAHKRELFDDIEKLRLIRCKKFVHEYMEDELTDIFDEVLEYTEDLINIINTTLKYINTKGLINDK